ncbi:coenzyme F420-dependent NADP oxidoreductase [Xylaria cf. heliscus]|nr:coenzyme F420-dependent NADP oxidoreductase [Xylaria cf. heliscus]
MRIGIVNAGNIGLNLAIPWIRQGHDIMLSKDTHPEKLRERVRTFGIEQGLNDDELSRFKYGSLADAAKFGNVVLLSAYFPRLDHVLKELHDAGVTLAGKVVIETMNPVNVDANFNHSHDLEYMYRTSVTEEIKKAFPDAILYKTFNNMFAPLLDARKWAPGRIPAVIFVGGNSSSTDTVRQLIEDAGFKPQFAGHDLDNARLLESLGVLFHRLVENEYQGDVNISFDLIKP